MVTVPPIDPFTVAVEGEYGPQDEGVTVCPCSIEERTSTTSINRESRVSFTRMCLSLICKIKLIGARKKVRAEDIVIASVATLLLHVALLQPLGYIPTSRNC